MLNKSKNTDSTYANLKEYNVELEQKIFNIFNSFYQQNHYVIFKEINFNLIKFRM